MSTDMEMIVRHKQWSRVKNSAFLLKWLPCFELQTIGRDGEEYDQTGSVKVIALYRKGSFILTAWSDWHPRGLDCANSDESVEGIQHSYRLVPIGKLQVKFKLVLILLGFSGGIEISIHVCLPNPCVKALICKKKGQGNSVRGGVYCEVLVSDWLFLVDCSKAVQLLLDVIIAARKKWLIGRQICQILLLAK